jgi:hypothetical protein
MGMSEEQVQGNPFAGLKALSGAVRKVKVAAPEDVLEERKTWPAEEMILPPDKRCPPKIDVVMKPGRAGVEFTIRGLSYAEKLEAERMVDSVIPPRKKRLEAVPGKPPVEVNDGFDEEDPKYLMAKAKAQADRLLYVVLKGVAGLEENTKGATPNEKLASLGEMNVKVIEFLASEIWHFGFSGRDAEDFCGSEG